MPWPSPQDYAEAVQSPRDSFSDPELQNGQVQLNALGLPRCLSGAFATVFCMQLSGKKVAVRCFLSNIKDQEERYAEISKFVLSDELPYTVGFEYQSEGIRIRGEWYPLLKMEWVEGETLSVYLDRVKEREAYGMLAGYFKQMTLELQRAGIAHGDLQHDNIMISETELRLVDYDGMFVPSLKDRKASELGHRNYQHPARNSSYFDSTLDNFSAWVIYASLRCLALDPSLWKQLDGGSDCLLFRNSDFVSPEKSKAFEILDAHANEKVRRFAGVVRHLLTVSLQDVPALDVPLHEKPLSHRSRGGMLEASDGTSHDGEGDPIKSINSARSGTSHSKSSYATDDQTVVALKDSNEVVIVEDVEPISPAKIVLKVVPSPPVSPGVHVYDPDNFYGQLSKIHADPTPSNGTLIHVKDEVMRQLLPGESIEWSSCQNPVEFMGASQRASILVGAVFMVLPLALYVLTQVPFMPLGATVMFAFALLLYGQLRDPTQRFFLITSQRLVVFEIGSTVLVYSVPLDEIEGVSIRDNCTTFIAKSHFATPYGSDSEILLPIPFAANADVEIVRALPRHIKVKHYIV